MGDQAGAPSLAYVGFPAPLTQIDAGVLVRVSLAHWWNPQDRPGQEERCYVQLSGWYGLDDSKSVYALSANEKINKPPQQKTQDISETLQSVFGYPGFLPLQRDAIDTILDGRNVLLVLPTGGGKSLCYQLPALHLSGLTVVISPLISLMQDQLRQLAELNIPATAIHSGLSSSELQANYQLVRQGKVKLLYLAPERLETNDIQLMLQQAQVQLFAVDEAHCISDWGHDFRPTYRNLSVVRERFPNAIWLALTATATPHVQVDILKQIGINDASILVGSFNRPNLFLRVERRTDEAAQILNAIAVHPESSGIIYCRTKREVDRIADWLVDQGIRALPYHADLGSEQRAENQRRFIYGEIDIIVATIAFGMGIDKPDVRFIIHADAPESLEAYYQQIGRAGRDGSHADCLLLYENTDFQIIESLIRNGNELNKDSALAALESFKNWVFSSACRRHGLLTYFGETDPHANCTTCDRCVVDLGDDDITIPAQMFLSCVIRTRQFFGRSHLINVLRGSKATRVRELGHHKISTYGIGSHISRQGWNKLVDQFLQIGLLELGGMNSLILSVTDKGYDALRGMSVFGEMPKSSRIKAEKSLKEPLDLLERLRSVRSILAANLGVPAYVICQDRTLEEMVTHLPQSRDQLMDIYGIGQHRANRYGDAFLSEIQRFRTESGHANNEVSQDIEIEEQATVSIPDGPISIPADRANIGSDALALDFDSLSHMSRRQWIVMHFEKGCRLVDIASGLNFQLATVINHLRSHIEEGHEISVIRLCDESGLPLDEQRKILKQFHRHGSARLAPIFEHFYGRVSYTALHVMRIVYLLENREQSQTPATSPIQQNVMNEEVAAEEVAAEEVVAEEVAAEEVVAEEVVAEEVVAEEVVAEEVVAEEVVSQVIRDEESPQEGLGIFARLKRFFRR